MSPYFQCDGSSIPISLNPWQNTAGLFLELPWGEGYIPVKLPWIFPGAPLKVNQAPRNSQGLTILGLLKLLLISLRDIPDFANCISLFLKSCGNQCLEKIGLWIAHDIPVHQTHSTPHERALDRWNWEGIHELAVWEIHRLNGLTYWHPPCIKLTEWINIF